MRPLDAPARLAAQQLEFAAHLRDPAAPPPPGVEERRLVVYRTLFFDNVAGMLGNSFPVLSRMLGDDAWRARVRDFYRDHRAATPLFPELAREFLRWLQDAPGAEDPPWLRELAHYEWVELALEIAEPAPLPAHDPDGDLLHGTPLLAPLAWPLAYSFAVHHADRDRPPQARPTFLLVSRDTDDRVQFREIELAGFRLLQAVAANVAGDQRPASGRELLVGLAAESGTRTPAEFVARGGELLQALRSRGVIVGTLG